jgi:hypothetical protein
MADDERPRWQSSRRKGPTHNPARGEPIEEDDCKGPGVYTRERLLAMDKKFCAAVERTLRPPKQR